MRLVCEELTRALSKDPFDILSTDRQTATKVDAKAASIARDMDGIAKNLQAIETRIARRLNTNTDAVDALAFARKKLRLCIAFLNEAQKKHLDPQKAEETITALHNLDASIQLGVALHAKLYLQKGSDMMRFGRHEELCQFFVKATVGVQKYDIPALWPLNDKIVELGLQRLVTNIGNSKEKGGDVNIIIRTHTLCTELVACDPIIISPCSIDDLTLLATGLQLDHEGASEQEKAVEKLKVMAKNEYTGLIKGAIAQKSFLKMISVVDEELKARRSVDSHARTVSSIAELVAKFKNLQTAWTDADRTLLSDLFSVLVEQVRDDAPKTNAVKDLGRVSCMIAEVAIDLVGLSAEVAVRLLVWCQTHKGERTLDTPVQRDQGYIEYMSKHIDSLKFHELFEALLNGTRTETVEKLRVVDIEPSLTKYKCAVVAAKALLTISKKALWVFEHMDNADDGSTGVTDLGNAANAYETIDSALADIERTKCIPEAEAQVKTAVKAFKDCFTMTSLAAPAFETALAACKAGSERTCKAVSSMSAQCAVQ